MKPIFKNKKSMWNNEIEKKNKSTKKIRTYVSL